MADPRRAVGYIRAYHGSPHRFDRFDISKLGTGEGNQTYGHGLYFAGREAVAQRYRDELARITIDGEDVDKLASMRANNSGKANPIHNIADYMAVYGSDVRDALREGAPDLIKVYDRLVKEDRIGRVGHMYEVNLKTRPDVLIDYDRGFNDQPSAFKDVLRSSLVRNGYLSSGETNSSQVDGALRRWSADFAYLHQNLIGSTLNRRFIAPTPEDIAATLRDAGIPGLRYLDQGSRGQNRGTHNYVMFDDNLIDILRRYAAGGHVHG